MKKQDSPASRLAAMKWLPTLFLLVAAGCGGGGDSSPPAEGPAPVPAPAPAPAASAPTVVDGGMIDANSKVGVATFPSGSTATGGHGDPVGNLACAAANQTVAFFTQLSIYQNGTQLQIPDRAGIVRDTLGNLVCVYPVHTHTGDFSGRIHREGPDATVRTLGDFFAVWGMPLTSTNVAGITTQPLNVYVIDNGTLTQFTGNPATIELQSHRHIALVLGTPVTQLPFYTWAGN